MNRSAKKIADQAIAYAHLHDRASEGGRFDDVSSEGPIRLATDQELLEQLSSVARLRRLVVAEETRLAGEVARRSESREDSLARKQGAGSAAGLVAQVTGVPRAQAGTMVASGIAFRSREALSGEALPAVCPQIARVFEEGRLDPEVAAGMRRALAKCATGLTPSELDELEAQLIAVAADGWDADRLLDWLKRVPEHAHPEGGRSGDDGPTPTPSVTRKELKNGLVRWVLELDALTDGFLRTAVDANTALTRTGLITPDMPQPDPDTDDRRPLAQRQVDGIARVAKKALKMDDGQVGGTAVTLLVAMTKQALETGLGTADLLDCGTTIPAGVARMLAADAEIIPVVLGGPSQPLDLGLGRRYFTEAQRRAMAIRDGGCVGPGCDAPPSWCDGAHIRPAGYGPTSLDNGVLLCWRCHLLHDLQGWQLTREDGRWLGPRPPVPTRREAVWRPCGWGGTPPPWVDPTGRRRPGGRIPPPAAAA